MYLSKNSVFLAALACLATGLASCGPEDGSAPAAAATLDRVAWLGSVSGWGLLGLPLGGGPLTYLSAENLESPTWAPPELGRISKAWLGDGAIWIQFSDSRLALYYYPTGHVLNFDSIGGEADAAVALEEGTGLVVARGGATLQLVAEAAPWRVRLEGPIERLVSAGNGWVLAVVDGADRSELVVLQPPQNEPLGRLQVNSVRDLVVTAWGDRLYYISEDDSELTVHELSLPELGKLNDIPLPAPGRAIAVTPSGHRLYIAVADSLLVYDRLRGERVRAVAMPGALAALRFSLNGANLMAKLEGDSQIAVLQVGVDSVMGVVPAEWDEHLPVGLPGGRMVVRVGGELALYDTPRMLEVMREEFDTDHEWLPVKWQPPRPRVELTRRTASQSTAEVRVAGDEPSTGDEGAGGVGRAAAAGHYAVVLAARQRAGVDDLVSWLRGVGYPSVVDRHRDVMGVEWFRAMVGPYPSREQAEAAAQSLAARYGYKPWILRVEAPEAAGDSTEINDAGATGDPGEESRGGRRLESGGR